MKLLVKVVGVIGGLAYCAWLLKINFEDRLREWHLAAIHPVLGTGAVILMIWFIYLGYKRDKSAGM